MSVIAPILGVLVLFVLAFSLIRLLRGQSYNDFRKRLVLKTLCSLMFWFFGWIALWYSSSGFVPFTVFMILGFTLSVLGDVFLVFKNGHSFIFGLLSFFLAHVSYSVSFIMRYGFSTGSMIVFAVISLIAFAIINFSGLFLLGEMRIFANLYLFILAFMLANAASALFSAEAGFLPAILTVLGALLFFFSDFTLAYEKFSGKRGLSLEKPILITYYSAQILLALGMMTFLIERS